MNSPQGWHPDPNDPMQERWWDGYQWTQATRPLPLPGESLHAASPPKKVRQWLWLLGSAIVAGVAIFLALPEGKASDNERMVSLCQKLVVDESTTPSTVMFISSNIATTTEGWLVSGEADGQNLFGAMVREQYACKVFYDEDKDMFSAAVVD